MFVFSAGLGMERSPGRIAWMGGRELIWVVVAFIAGMIFGAVAAFWSVFDGL